MKNKRYARYAPPVVQKLIRMFNRFPSQRTRRAIRLFVKQKGASLTKPDRERLFQKLLFDHLEHDAPLSALRQLAQVLTKLHAQQQLFRSLSEIGEIDAARRAYEKFLQFAESAQATSLSELAEILTKAEAQRELEAPLGARQLRILSEIDAARRAYERAKDLDVKRLRRCKPPCPKVFWAAREDTWGHSPGCNNRIRQAASRKHYKEKEIWNQAVETRREFMELVAKGRMSEQEVDRRLAAQGYYYLSFGLSPAVLAPAHPVSRENKRLMAVLRRHKSRRPRRA